MNNHADLHIHSSYSDGAWSPKKILEEASNRRLHTISITDHDTFSGSVMAWNMADQYPVEVILGIEFSCTHQGEDVHVLGYFLQDVSMELESFLLELQQRRRSRAHQMVACFQTLNIDLSHMDLDGYGDSIGRPHFAKELLRLKVVQTFDEAFEKYLKRGRPCYIENVKVSVKECIEIIGRYGGVSVLAHPGLLKSPDILESLLDFQPDGLEVYHSKHSQKDRIRLYNIAKNQGLLVSGGSDFHEETKNRLVGIGSEKIPVRYVESLKDKINSMQYKPDTTILDIVGGNEKNEK
jgi:hypothetical protein